MRKSIKVLRCMNITSLEEATNKFLTKLEKLGVAPDDVNIQFDANNRETAYITYILPKKVPLKDQIKAKIGETFEAGHERKYNTNEKV